MPKQAGFTASPSAVQDVVDWFDRYDAMVMAKDFDGMADQAMFPLNEVTDGKAASCDRARFVAQMAEHVGGSDQITMDSVRTPHFIDENLVFVITDSVITAGEFSQQVRYGDLLVRCAGGWRFQTMVQGGWGDF